MALDYESKNNRTKKVRLLSKKINIVVIIVVILFVMNFIPIKIAVKKESVKKGLIFNYTQTTAGNYVATTKNNSALNDSCYLRMSKEQYPFNILNEMYKTDYDEPSGNEFVFEGEMVYNELTGGYDMVVEKWNIIYPIRRKSIRRFFTPDNYLTVYDFELMDSIVYFWDKMGRQTVE